VPFSDGNNVASALLTTVPAGKQFVVTYASASAHLSVATHASFRILKSSSLGTVAVYELKPVSTETIAGIVASEPLHIFVNAGESLTAIVARDSLTGTGPVFVTVSGDLVDNP